MLVRIMLTIEKILGGLYFFKASVSSVKSCLALNLLICMEHRLMKQAEQDLG